MIARGKFGGERACSREPPSLFPIASRLESPPATELRMAAQLGEEEVLLSSVSLCPQKIDL
jgi:hypothetical protein